MFDPRSILLHVDDSKRLGVRAQLARQLAQTFGASVTAQHAAMPFLLRYPLTVESAAEAIALVEQADEEARRAARASFEAAVGEAPNMVWSALACDAFTFTNRALYADLVIVGQRDDDDSAAGELPPDFVQNLIIDSGKPVLVVPKIGAITPEPRQVLIAWKETRESARAVMAALPWLRRAESVGIACFDDDARAAVTRLSGWLDAHGIATVSTAEGPPSDDVGEMLLSRAFDVGAELLVMGCYGHSRAREWVLGGVTRTLLQSMTLPVLMVH